MADKNRNRVFIYDLILVLLLLVVGLSALFIFKAVTKEGNSVRVLIDGELVARYSLSVDGEYSINGGTNILKIENGKAYMIYADCNENPDFKCTRQGKISKELESIDCLPNRVRVEVEIVE